MNAATAERVGYKQITHAAGTGLNSTLGRAYCGSKSTNQTKEWAAVDCENCHAARRADKAAS